MPPPDHATGPGWIPNVAATKMDARQTHPGTRISAWRLATAPSVTVLDTVSVSAAAFTGRIAQRLLCLAARAWRNHQLGGPRRALVAGVA